MEGRTSTHNQPQESVFSTGVLREMEAQPGSGLAARPRAPGRGARGWRVRLCRAGCLPGRAAGGGGAAHADAVTSSSRTPHWGLPEPLLSRLHVCSQNYRASSPGVPGPVSCQRLVEQQSPSPGTHLSTRAGVALALLSVRAGGGCGLQVSSPGSLTYTLSQLLKASKSGSFADRLHRKTGPPSGARPRHSGNGWDSGNKAVGRALRHGAITMKHGTRPGHRRGRRWPWCEGHAQPEVT